MIGFYIWCVFNLRLHGGKQTNIYYVLYLYYDGEKTVLLLSPKVIFDY